jgi:4-hydroxy-tetrahydrodipicolinate reductase
MTSKTSNKPLKIGVCGSSGKMGQSIIALAKLYPNEYEISSTYEGINTTEYLKNFCQNSNIIIDFSSPALLPYLIDNCLTYSKPVVIGTTGLTEEHFKVLKKASIKIPVFYSANMSLGANLLAMLAEKAAKILTDDYDVEIIDRHHRYKKDSPSGTALMIGKQIAKTRSVDFKENAAFANDSNYLRGENEIRFSSIRAGNILGEHEVMFAADNEILSLNHHVSNREVFAKGALIAAVWLIDKQNGLYSMMDVIDFEMKL